MLLRPVSLLLLSWAPVGALGRAVFAHFMVGNTCNYSVSTWTDDINAARAAHIDAFALNIAYGEECNNQQIENAFTAASSAPGFYLFFSFDYAGGLGGWPKDQVVSLLTRYGHHQSHYLHQGKTFASTFEGPEAAADWRDIRKALGCFFVPDWSSLGAQAAVELGGDDIDGLFSWAAWSPKGKQYGQFMDTYVDASYQQFLGEGKAYMMPVSPCFYSNMPVFGKNWMWQTGGQWFERWYQALVVQPDFIEIISWNDYGESHYIGPVRPEALYVFDKQMSGAPYNYAKDRNHDGWRDILPYAIDLYKTGTASTSQEMVTVWYIENPHCDSLGTVINAASHRQIEMLPGDAGDDMEAIHIAALLADPVDAHIDVVVGGKTLTTIWDYQPDDGKVGIYRATVTPSGITGDVIVNIRRQGSVALTVTGSVGISADCSKTGPANFNPVVTTGVRSFPRVVSPAENVQMMNCTAGMSPVAEFRDLCEWTCMRGYCPPGACQCTQIGHLLAPYDNIVRKEPGYPAPGIDGNYIGLCAVSCSMDYCPKKYCISHFDQKNPPPVPIATLNPFTPAVCKGGTGPDDDVVIRDLCKFTCGLGFCPIQAGCVCDGPTVALPTPPQSKAIRPDYKYDGNPGLRTLCAVACAFGNCPDAVCKAPQMMDCKDETQCPMLPLPGECDKERKFKNLGQLADQSDDMLPNCAAYHAARVLRDLVGDAQGTYREALDGYDNLWPVFRDHVISETKTQLATIMCDTGSPIPDLLCSSSAAGVALKHFECRRATGWNLDYPGDDKTKKVDCNNRFSGSNDDMTYYFTLKDREGFAKTLSDWGMSIDSVEYTTVDLPGGCNAYVGDSPCVRGGSTYRGFPTLKKDWEPENPKKTLEAAGDGVEKVKAAIDLLSLELDLDVWDGAPEDIVEVYAMPAFMLLSTIDSMNDIKEKAREYAEEDTQNLAFDILNWVLMMTPIAGGLLASYSKAGLMIARLMGVFDTGVTLVDTAVNDPSMLPFIIVMLVLGVGGTEFAGAKIDRTPGDIGKLGRGVRGLDEGLKDKLSKGGYKQLESTFFKVCKRK